MKKFAGLIITISILIVILLFSCDIPTGRKPVCRHNAVYASITYSDLTGQPVGIAVGFTDSKDRHAQAFTISPAGKIQWLELAGGEVIIGDQDNFYPYTLITISEFQDRYVKIKEFDKDGLDNLLRQLCDERSK